MTFERPGDASQCLVLEACLKVSILYSLLAYANMGKDYVASPAELRSTNGSLGEHAVVSASCVFGDPQQLTTPHRQPAGVLPSELVAQVPLDPMVMTVLQVCLFDKQAPLVSEGCCCSC